VALLEIKKETCTKCGACAAVCPGGYFTSQNNEYPRPVPMIEKICIRCGHCVAVCPTDSVMHRECPVEKCPSIEPNFKVNIEWEGQLIRSRRSIRAYKDKPVSREDILRLIDIARYAPSGGNAQGVHWLVIDNKEQIRRFSEIGTEWMYSASKNGSEDVAKLANVIKLQEAGKDGFLRKAPVLIIAYGKKNNSAATNTCTIALSYFDLAAWSMGLGCMWAGFFMFAAASFPPMIKEIALPDEYRVCGAMTLGYPKFQYHRIPMRKPAEITWR
jgi:nitroreductase/NAD-dependent dihydropyrimidine dehydrogenase PreA subunit